MDGVKIHSKINSTLQFTIIFEWCSILYNIFGDFCVWSIFRKCEDKHPIFQKHQCRYITITIVACYIWILIVSMRKRFFGIKSWFLHYGVLSCLDPCLAHWPLAVALIIILQSNLDYPNPFGQGKISNRSDKQGVRITLTTPKPHPWNRSCMQKRIIWQTYRAFRRF